MKFSKQQRESLRSRLATPPEGGGHWTGSSVRLLVRTELGVEVSERTCRTLLQGARDRSLDAVDASPDDVVVVCDLRAMRKLVVDLGVRWRSRTEPPHTLEGHREDRWKCTPALAQSCGDEAIGEAAFCYFAGRLRNGLSLGFERFASVAEILHARAEGIARRSFFDTIYRGRPLPRARWMAFGTFAREVLGGSQDIDNQVKLRVLKKNWAEASKLSGQSILAMVRRIEEVAKGVNAREYRKLLKESEAIYRLRRHSDRPGILCVDIVKKHQVLNLTETPLQLNPSRWYEYGEAEQIQSVGLSVTVGDACYNLPLHLAVDRSQPSFGLLAEPEALAEVPPLLPASSPAAQIATVCWTSTLHVPEHFRDVIVGYLPAEDYRIALLESSDPDLELRIGDQPSLRKAPLRPGERLAWTYTGLMLSHHVIGIRFVPRNFENALDSAVDALADRLVGNGVVLTQRPTGESWGA